MTYADYKFSLRGLSDESYKKAVKECHERSAFKLQKLCFANGGIYIKLGQHVAQLVRYRSYGLQTLHESLAAHVSCAHMLENVAKLQT